MRRSMRSNVFRMFDKVIVAALLFVAVIYFAIEFTREQVKVIDPATVDRLLAELDKKERSASHKETPLVTDYMTGTMGGMRPDLTAIEPRDGIFGRPAKPVPPFPTDIKLTLPPPPAPAKPFETDLSSDDAACDAKVPDDKIAKARVDKDKRLLRVDPVGPGRTRLQMLRGQDVVHDIPVVVELVDVEPKIGPPRQFAAAPGQGQVELSWETPDLTEATVKEYRVHRQEPGRNEQLLVRIPVPAPLEPGAQLPTIGADGKPGAPATHKAGRFSLVDPTAQGGIMYNYTVLAAGVDKKAKVLEGPRAGPVSVQVEEPFKITYIHLSSIMAAVVVEVFHVPAGGGAARTASSTFHVRPGQPVGWKVKDVDYSTGYQVLDILPDERWFKEVPKGKDEAGNPVLVQEEQQPYNALLIINERGRIKVLRPKGVGPD